MLEVYRNTHSHHCWNLQPCINETYKPGAFVNTCFVFCNGIFSPSSPSPFLGGKSHFCRRNVCMCAVGTNKCVEMLTLDGKLRVCLSICLPLLSPPLVSIKQRTDCHWSSPSFCSTQAASVYSELTKKKKVENCYYARSVNRKFCSLLSGKLWLHFNDYVT